tara:strand:+ start:407 stop:727 length:321 start_codon:yes stop_codon:yes gene_type:complete
MKIINIKQTLLTKKGYVFVTYKKRDKGYTIFFESEISINRWKKDQNQEREIGFRFSNITHVSLKKTKDIIKTNKDIADFLGLDYMHKNYIKQEKKRKELFKQWAKK